MEVDGERLLRSVFCLMHHQSILVCFWAWSLLLGSTSKMVIAQLDYLVPINFTAGIMISWVQNSPLFVSEDPSGKQDLALYHWCSLLDSWVFNFTNWGNRVFFPHKSCWIVQSQMLQVHEVATPRNRSSVLGVCGFAHHQRNSKWCSKETFFFFSPARLAQSGKIIQFSDLYLKCWIFFKAIVANLHYTDDW